MNENFIFAGVMGITLLGMGGAGLYAVKTLKNASPLEQDVVSEDDVENAQEFIPIVDIREGVLELGGNRYRAILECSSVNYNLKTDMEREVIELAFQNFISSLSFPITFHIQTRVIDNTLIVRELEKDLEVLKVKNPGLLNYGEMYLESIKSFDTHLDECKQKKKYIIIPYEDTSIMNDLTGEEKFEFAIHQIKDRIEFVKNQLSSMGIKAERLTNADLIETVYSSYHRDSSNLDISQLIDDGEYFVPVVMSEERNYEITPEKKIDLELVKIQNMIKEELMSRGNGLDYEKLNIVKGIHDELGRVRDNIGSPYGTNIKMSKYVENYKNKEDLFIDKPEKSEKKACSAIYSKEEVAKVEEVVSSDFNFDFMNDNKEEIVSNDFSFDFMNDDKEEIASNDFSFDFIDDDKEGITSNDFSFDFIDDDKEEITSNDFSFDFIDNDKEDIASNDFSFDFDLSYEKSEKKDEIIKDEIVIDDLDYGSNYDDIIGSNKSDRLKDLMIFED